MPVYGVYIYIYIWMGMMYRVLWNDGFIISVSITLVVVVIIIRSFFAVD